MTMPDNMMARNAAESGIGAGRSRGYPLGDKLTAAIDRLRALDRIVNEPYLPVASPPIDPADLGAWLAGQAAERRTHGETVAEARVWQGPAVAALVASYRELVPGWTAKLVTEFAGAVAAFAAVAETAPAVLTAASDDDQVAAYRAVLTAAGTLDRLAATRTQIGGSIAEQGAGSLLAVAEVPPLPGDPGALNDAWPDLHAALGHMRMPAGVDGWRGLLAAQTTGIVVSMAGAGGIQSRSDRLDSWRSWTSVVNTSAGGTQRYTTAMAAGRTAYATGPRTTAAAGRTSR